MSRADHLAPAAWHLTQTAPGAAARPNDLDPAAAEPTTVPGTTAAHVRRTAGTPAALAHDHDGSDWWWTTTVDLPDEPMRLVLDGVATHWELFCDGEQVATGTNMFRGAEVDLGTRPGPHTLALVCRSLAAADLPRRPRPAWRSAHVSDARLRWARTTGLGRLAWPGTAAVVGPWRPLRIEPWPDIRVTDVTTRLVAGQVHARLEGTTETGARLVTGDTQLPLPAGPFAVEVPTGVGAWWPHTHGTPAYADLEVQGARGCWRRRVGHADITADRADDGFTLVVNGIRVHARGMAWMPPDPFDPAGDPRRTRAVLERLAAAGACVIRVPGTNTWLPDDFHDACIELGLLVWQDAMLHTLAPPDDPAWLADLAAEVRHNLAPRVGQPHIAVVSGGSETEQQPELWGLGRPAIPALDATVPTAAEAVLPGVPRVSSTPSGGWRATAVGAGISHWFGVGWYGADFAEADRVRFAAECLAFGLPPERASLAQWGVAPGDPTWRAGTPRDRGAARDFVDVLAAYAERLFGTLPDDADQRVDLLRAASVEVFGRVATRWRRPGSRCSGGITIAAHDLARGPGWGLLDADGQPKAAWYALARAWRPRAVLVTEEGQDGFAAHLVNDRSEPWHTDVRFTAHALSGAAEDAVTSVTVPAHGAVTVWPEEHLGFRDLTHAWAFGPLTWAALTVQAGEVVQTAVPDAALRTVLAAEPAYAVERVADDRVRVTTQGVLPYVQLTTPAADGWLHVAGTRELAAGPGEVRLATVRAPRAG